MVQQVLLFSHSLQLRVPPLISCALLEVATESMQGGEVGCPKEAPLEREPY